MNALQESLCLFNCLMKLYAPRHFKQAQIELLFNEWDLFQQKIDEKGKSISDCFEDFKDWNSQNMQSVVGHFLSKIAGSEVMIPSLVIALCAKYTETSGMSLKFITEKFKSLVPAQFMSSFCVQPPCTAIQKEDVQRIFEDIVHRLYQKWGRLSFCRNLHSGILYLRI